MPTPSFHDELVAKLTDPHKQKPYKESSVKPVWVYLRTLNGGQDPVSLDYLLDRPVVLRYLGKYAVSTQRSIVFVIRNVAKDFGRDDIIEVWKENIADTEAGKGLPPKGEKSEAQAQAYALVESDKGGDAWDMLTKKLDTLTADHGQLQYVVPNLYIKFPPRRNIDYTEMKITTDYKDDMPQTHNYLVVGEEGDGVAMRFVFNKYKTSGVYNRQVFDVPDDLVSVLMNWIKATDKKDGDYLLTKTGKGVHNKGDALRSDDLTDVLHKAFGRGISTQMLRHMYLDKYNTPERRSVIAEMMGDAEQMAHSIGTQQHIYVKNPSKKAGE